MTQHRPRSPHRRMRTVTAEIGDIVAHAQIPRRLAWSALRWLPSGHDAVLRDRLPVCAASESGASTFPIAWGFAIVNFVWWIGIGHAGTLISAILLLLKQDWRTSINRFAEAMTLFAVACAGMFPILHLGRPWLFYWLLPYPNTM